MVTQVLSDGFFKEILILRADYFRLSDYRGLNNNHVIYVPNGGSLQRVQGYDFRRSAKGGDIVVNKIFREAKEFLQSAVAKHSRKFVEHLV